MKGKFQDAVRHEGYVPEVDLDSLVAHFPRMKINNLHSSVLQQHNIVSPLTIITETFDAGERRIMVEMLDNETRLQKTFGPREYELFLTRPPHTHNYLELMIVLSGSIQNEIEQETFTYRAGQGCIMNKNIRHREIPEADAEVLFLELREEFVRELLQAEKTERTSLKDKEFTTFLETSSIGDEKSYRRHYWDFSPVSMDKSILKAQELVCASISSLRTHRPGNSYLIRGAILNYLSELCDPSVYRLQSFSSDIGHTDFLVSKIEFLISATHGRIGQKELEEQLSYQGDYLNRIYKRKRGKSISAASKEVLIEQAKELLRETDWSVEEIIEYLHVTSRGFFFSSFQKAVGMSPREYRKTASR
jgi:AraC-like DNA-binding protein/mannose-6-phosphate isomerase-like protein (cupin superfamily)